MSERDQRLTFVILWAFVLFNYIYGDIGMIFSVLIDPDMVARIRRTVSGMGSVDLFFLVFAMVMEASFATLLLSWLAPLRIARWANIITGILFTLLMAVIIFAGGVPPANYYTFFGLVEIAATSYIAWRAWRWRAAVATG